MSLYVKSSLYRYIKYIWFLNIFLIAFLNKPDPILGGNSVRWFQVLLCNHHHHIVLAARISLTLSRHSSLSFIALGRVFQDNNLYPHIAAECTFVLVVLLLRGPCVGIHKSTSLMSSSLLLQQCPACLVRLTWIVFVIGGRWPYSWCLVGCCCQDLLRIARSIFKQAWPHFGRELS